MISESQPKFHSKNCIALQVLQLLNKNPWESNNKVLMVHMSLQCLYLDWNFLMAQINEEATDLRGYIWQSVPGLEIRGNKVRWMRFGISRFGCESYTRHSP